MAGVKNVEIDTEPLAAAVESIYDNPYKKKKFLLYKK